ncbi:MAG: Transketolase [Chaenotheca gracillima]|nr:MAG: Transketolase [Chaenotheca gracillima]
MVLSKNASAGGTRTVSGDDAVARDEEFADGKSRLTSKNHIRHRRSALIDKAILIIPGRQPRIHQALDDVPIIVQSASPATAAASSAIRPLTYKSHQRRHSSSSSSSSKPSNSSDGSRSLPQQQEQQQQKASSEESSQTSQEGTPASARISRRKARETAADGAAKGKEDVLMNLPSVPSTRDVHPADVAISAFFSLYRPISVTGAVPKLASSKSFDNIFTSRPKPAKSAEVIGTLSSAVESLEAAQQEVQQAQSYDPNSDPDLHAAVTAASSSNNPHHLDGPPTDSPLKFPSHVLSGRYQPFSPPPAPASSESPASETATTEESSASDLPSATLKRSYSTILTILERTHTNGSKTYTARASPIKENDGSSEADTIDPGNFAFNPARMSNPSSFLGRMRLRQNRLNEFRRERMGDWKERAPGSRSDGERASGEDGGMWAISVKRQRRLKMKKHKYKKLMRKTRNLRRRLEKT